MSAIDPEDSFATGAVTRARQRLDASDSAGDVLVARRAGFLDLFPPSTLLAIVVAIVAISLVDLRAAAAPHALTAFDFLLRVVTAMALLRVCVRTADGVGRVRAIRRRTGRAIVLLDDALVVFGDEPTVIHRRDVIASAGGLRADGLAVAVVVARNAHGSPVIDLPIPDDLGPESVARRIERFRDEYEGPRDAAPGAFPPPGRDPAREFDRVVSHEGAGETKVHTGTTWLRDLPIAGPAFGLVLIERALSLGSIDGLLALGPWVLTVLGVAVAFPLVTVVLGYSRMRSMGGAAIVATPAEMLVRTRAGMHRVAWDAIVAIATPTRRGFSMLAGVSPRSMLIIERASGAAIRIDGAWLLEPANVVRTILEAYCDGAGTPPSQGTGAGGGISDVDATTT